MRRTFTIILLLVEAMFFNVVIPGHARGMIELPGSAPGPACCAAKHGKPNQTPCDSKRAAHCAVCAFAARMTVPPVVDFVLPPSGFVETVTTRAIAPIDVTSYPLPYFGRAPPLAA